MAEHIYTIIVEGHLDRQWSGWFDDMSFSYTGNDDTILLGPVADQAALHGILHKVRDLRLALIFLSRFEVEHVSDPPHPI